MHKIPTTKIGVRWVGWVTEIQETLWGFLERMKALCSHHAKQAGYTMRCLHTWYNYKCQKNKCALDELDGYQNFKRLFGGFWKEWRLFAPILQSTFLSHQHLKLFHSQIQACEQVRTLQWAFYIEFRDQNICRPTILHDINVIVNIMVNKLFKLLDSGWIQEKIWMLSFTCSKIFEEKN